MASSDKATWSAILVIGLIDIVWSANSRLTFVGVWPAVAFAAGMIGLAVWLRLSGRMLPFARMVHYTAMWFCLMGFVGVLSYLAASVGAPLRDDDFARLDAALGFDWQSMYVWLSTRPSIEFLLTLIYMTFLPQVVGTVALLAWSGEERVCSEFLAALLLSAVTVVAISGILPAFGPCAKLQGGLPQLIDSIPHVAALRSGAPLVIPLGEMKGIVSFPSFHTVAALLLIYAHRRGRRLFAGSVLLNGVMLFCIPRAGGHYLVDVLAGAAVAGLVILLARLTPAAFWRSEGGLDAVPAGEAAFEGRI
ncbi:MAG TPA: phosphatase PAP2 family protein [Stellaceae bacterium]|nr:phosphatase PAP2 family protein [Stellaceae bacterium]